MGSARVAVAVAAVSVLACLPIVQGASSTGTDSVGNWASTLSNLGLTGFANTDGVAHMSRDDSNPGCLWAADKNVGVVKYMCIAAPRGAYSTAATIAASAWVVAGTSGTLGYAGDGFPANRTGAKLSEPIASAIDGEAPRARAPRPPRRAPRASRIVATTAAPRGGGLRCLRRRRRGRARRQSKPSINNK